MIGDVGRADRAEEDRVEASEPFEPAFRNVMTVLEVVVAAPGEVLHLEGKSAIPRGEHLEHLEPGCDDLRAYAVARNGGNPVFAHA